MNSLLRDKLFLFVAIPTFALLVWSTVSITFHAYGVYQFTVLGTDQDWNRALELYRIPLSVAVGLLGVFALFTSIHRVSLQAAQTNLQSRQADEAQKLNEFNIYFKQREEFDKKFQVSMGEWFKAVQRNVNVRNHEWFDDFDHMKWDKVDIEDDRLMRIAGIACFNLYEFSFGSGRSIFMTEKFRALVSQVFYSIDQVGCFNNDVDEKQSKSLLNTLINDALSKTGKYSDWCMLYNSEWFSVNEKFNLSLAVARLFAEIEAFAGEPREIECISTVIASGQSAEDSLFFGPNLLMGERKLSSGGAQGRVPNLLSRVLRPTDGETKSDRDQ